MKRILTICCVNLLWLTPVLRAGADVKTREQTEKNVSFYEVPWQCPAAPAIGCGSHAKPILLELERHTSVREAWLNRRGTMVAVVWKPDAKKKGRRDVEKILKEKKALKVVGGLDAKALVDFNSGKGWYRGAEVDRLSEEEAGVIAARWVRRVQARTTLAKEKAEGLERALTDALKNYLTGKVSRPEGMEERDVE